MKKCKGVLKVLFLAVVLLPFLFAASGEKVIRLATTTSVDNTGLLDYLAERFHKDTGIKLQWVAVGTGKALRLAREGNADLVWVHCKKLEQEFLREGYGVKRRVIARNYFIIVGPGSDPAGVKQASSLKEALLRIKSSGVPFISRGDGSGTHQKELYLWSLVGGKPEKNYLETGQGMAQTLRVTQEKQAYTLCDTGTFYGIKGISGLVPVFSGSPELENIYSVIAVNPFKWKNAHYQLAMRFIAWITSPVGQELLRNYKREGKILFEPIADIPGVDLVK